MRIVDFFLFFLFLILISSLVYIAVVLKSDGYACLNNPLVYGAVKLKEVNTAEFSCECNLNKPSSPVISFNSSGLFIRNTESRSSIIINFTEMDKLIPVGKR